MVQDTPSRKLDQYIVRFPDGMRDEIKAAADVNGRSMNAEIVQRLKFSFADLDDDQLHLKLPEDVISALSVDAIAHGVSQDERAAQIISGAYDRDTDLALTLDRLEREIVRNADLLEQANDLKERLERDFVLYYGKAIQLSQFVSLLLGAAGDSLPDTVKRAAEELQALNHTEIAMLKQRYEDALEWIRYRDNEARNARDADSGGEIDAAEILPMINIIEAMGKKKP